MNLAHAQEIVQTPADGVDPYTGARFPAGGLYQRADTVRALYATLEAAESSHMLKNPVDPAITTPPSQSRRLPILRSHHAIRCLL